MNRQSSQVGRFLLRVAIFWSPFILVGALLEWAFWKTGESWPVRHVLAYQDQHREVHFGRKYLDQSLHLYKFMALQQRHPEIAAIGSSRVMQFRPAMFGTDDERFYNAGGILQNVNDFRALLKLRPDFHPKVVVLGIDSWWLNDAWRDSSNDEMPADVARDATFRWENHLLAARKFVMAAGAVDLVKAVSQSSPHLGIGVRRTGLGFRYDGSLERDLPKPTTAAGWAFVDRDEVPFLRRLRNGTMRFEVTERISLPKLKILRQCIATLKSRGTLVLGFLPPMFTEGATILETDARYKNFWSQYRSQVASLFKELALPFVDASSPAKLGLDDRYMTDGVHAAETLHVYLLLQLLEDPRAQQALPGLANRLRAIRDSPKTDYWTIDGTLGQAKSPLVSTKSGGVG